MYIMNSNDWCDTWTDSIPGYASVDRGYCVSAAPSITTQELDSNQFDSQMFAVERYSGSGVPPTQNTATYFLSKMDFFKLWIGQKLQPCSYGGNPPLPGQYTGFGSLAIDFGTFLSKNQSYYQTDSGAQDFSAKVKGLMAIATRSGFPAPQGALEQLADFVNSIISAFINDITAIWNNIIGFVGSAVNFVLTVWNNIVGPILGAVTEAVKSIVDVSISIITSPLKILFSNLINNVPNGINYFSNVDLNSTKSLITENSNIFSYNSNLELPSINQPNLGDIPSILGQITELVGPSLFNNIINIIFSDFVNELTLAIAPNIGNDIYNSGIINTNSNSSTTLSGPFLDVMSSGTKNFGSNYNLNNDVINPTFVKMNNLLGFINQNQNDKNLLNNAIYAIVKTIPLIFGINSETQNFNSYAPQKQAYFNFLLVTGLNAYDHIISLFLYDQELENSGSPTHINYFSLILKVIKGSLDLIKCSLLGEAISILKANNLEVPAPFYASLIQSAMDYSILAISTFGSDIVSSLVFWIALIITGIYSLQNSNNNLEALISGVFMAVIVLEGISWFIADIFAKTHQISKLVVFIIGTYIAAVLGELFIGLEITNTYNFIG